jgi:hypothetical protein
MARPLDSASHPDEQSASRRAALVAIATLAWPAAARLIAQSITASRVGDAVTVRAPGLGFIKGEPLLRLKDGRTVRVDLDLAVLPGPGGSAVAHGRQTYVLSYDLWEERFAVTMAGTPGKSASYLTAPAAEAWCVEQLTVPVSSIGRLARDTPFWVRLEYRVLDGEGSSASDDAGLSLRGLIEAFSRRPKANAWTHSIEAGPFRLGS